MFVQAVILAIIIGFILKGKLSNLDQININGFGFIITSFFMEFIIVMLIQNSVIQRGVYTYILDLIMYILIFIFTYRNRRNIFILTMGVGFLLNAIPIFFNGGAMPVSEQAIKIANISINIEKEGLYTLVNEGTRFWILGDIIPFLGVRNAVVSIGDITAVLGMMLLIISGMRLKDIK